MENSREKAWRHGLLDCHSDLEMLDRNYVRRDAMVPEPSMVEIRRSLDRLSTQLTSFKASPMGISQDTLKGMREDFDLLDSKMVKFVRDHALVASRIDPRADRNAIDAFATRQQIVNNQNENKRRQDLALDHIGVQVRGVGNISNSIHEEVTLSTGLLDELGDRVEIGREHMGHANREAAQVIERGGTW